MCEWVCVESKEVSTFTFSSCNLICWASDLYSRAILRFAHECMQSRNACGIYAVFLACTPSRFQCSRDLRVRYLVTAWNYGADIKLHVQPMPYEWVCVCASSSGTDSSRCWYSTRWKGDLCNECRMNSHRSLSIFFLLSISVLVKRNLFHLQQNKTSCIPNWHAIAPCRASQVLKLLAYFHVWSQMEFNCNLCLPCILDVDDLFRFFFSDRFVSFVCSNRQFNSNLIGFFRSQLISR